MFQKSVVLVSTRFSIVLLQPTHNELRDLRVAFWHNKTKADGNNSHLLLEDINYDIEVDTLAAYGFTEYFSAKGSDPMIEAGMQPPANAKEVFMGCGPVGSKVLKMGVFGPPEELFDHTYYPHCTTTNAKAVRLYHAYYSTEGNNAIGFAKGPSVQLCNA